jgi:N-acetylglutamate synthase
MLIAMLISMALSEQLPSTRAIEELSLNAWPALHTILYDGWLLRSSRGYTRRANSVNPIYPSTLPIDDKVQFCEETCAAAGQVAVFKITPAIQPPELDGALEERGYRREAVTSVQTIDLAGVDGMIDEAINIDEQLESTWIADFCRLNAVPQRHVATMMSMLGAIVPATGFATLRREGETVAVGLAVCERHDVGLFDIVTAPHARGQGIGRRLVLGLLRWGRAGGAKRGYLQVMVTNEPALGLYEKLGFREAYRYWYRVKAANG